MAQLSWTYVGQMGYNYEVGLYHGEESGHVIIYCNQIIVVIDFKIFENKMYSFFLGDELCELHFFKQIDNLGFKYELKINDKVETPLNIARKRESREYDKYAFIIGVIFLVAILSLLLWKFY